MNQPIRTLSVNLYGGPGTGKSTTAALLFALLKQQGVNCELAREYVKEWAWEGRVPGPFDQFYFFGKQSRKESLLYGKVDLVVTDCPVILGAFYAQKYSQPEASYGIREVTKSFYNTAEQYGHRFMHIMLKRTKAYNPAGRYQTEEEARQFDVDTERFLRGWPGMMLHESGTSVEQVEQLAKKVLDCRRFMAGEKA